MNDRSQPRDRCVGACRIEDRIPTDLEDAVRRHADLSHGVVAQRTLHGMRSDAVSWHGVFARRGRTCLPATPKDVAAYVDEESAVTAPATIRRHLNTIKLLHRAMGHPDPTADPLVRAAVRRMHRTRGRRQRQATALRRLHVDAMLTMGEERRGIRTKAIRDRALLAVAYGTGRRRSELVALVVEDIEAKADGSGTILVRRSKRDQEGDGKLAWLAPDTMRRIDAWLRRARLRSGPLFRTVHRSGRVMGPLPADSVGDIWRGMAIEAGIPATMANRFSAHSTRVGLAQDMAAARCSLPQMKTAGGWNDDRMPLRYAEAIAVEEAGSAHLARLQGRT